MGVTGHKIELIGAKGDGNIVFGAAKWSAKGKDANGLCRRRVHPNTTAQEVQHSASASTPAKR
jgi:hypothetical protein